MITVLIGTVFNPPSSENSPKSNFFGSIFLIVMKVYLLIFVYFLFVTFSRAIFKLPCWDSVSIVMRKII